MALEHFVQQIPGILGFLAARQRHFGKVTYNPVIHSSSQRMEMDLGSGSLSKEARCQLPGPKSLAVLLTRERKSLAHADGGPTGFQPALPVSLRQDPISPKRINNYSCPVFALRSKSHSRSYRRMFTSYMFMDYLDSKSEGNEEWVA